MINEQNFPAFDYFMSGYMCEDSDHAEQLEEFILSEPKESVNDLAEEAARLMKYDEYELQAFIKRSFGRKIDANSIKGFLKDIMLGECFLIKNAINKFKDRQIGLTELQEWFSTLPLSEVIDRKQIGELENRLEMIRFCETAERQYSEVMKAVGIVLEKLQ